MDITSEEMYHKIQDELSAAHYFANASEDPEEVESANNRILECERAIEAYEST